MAEAIDTQVRTMDEAFERLLEADSKAEYINPSLRRNAPLPPGPSLVPVARYTDRRYHELEKERLWSRTWQMAAHEDDFPSVGSVVPYDIADRSYLIVRVAEDELQGLLQRVPAPRSQAPGAARQGPDGAALPVPRLDVGAGRTAEADSVCV